MIPLGCGQWEKPWLCQHTGQKAPGCSLSVVRAEHRRDEGRGSTSASPLSLRASVPEGDCSEQNEQGLSSAVQSPALLLLGPGQCEAPGQLWCPAKIYNSVFTPKTGSAQKSGQPWPVLVPCWGSRNPLFDFTSNKSLHLVGFPCHPAASLGTPGHLELGLGSLSGARTERGRQR